MKFVPWHRNTVGKCGMVGGETGALQFDAKSEVDTAEDGQNTTHHPVSCISGVFVCKIDFDTAENEPYKAVFLYFLIPQIVKNNCTVLESFVRGLTFVTGEWDGARLSRSCAASAHSAATSNPILMTSNP